MPEQVTILSNTYEHCPAASKPVMTLYFSGRPTVKQLMKCVASISMAYKEKPDLESKHLKFYYTTVGEQTRIQVVS